MAVESDEDRLAFLDPELFGVEAVYTPKSTGVAGEPIAGIFDEEHATFDPNRFMGGPEYAQQMGAKFTSTGPKFTCRAVDLPDGGKKGSKLSVGGATYRVHDRRPDGTGMVVLVLMEDE